MTVTPGERAWLWLAGGIIAWDILGAETLSAAAARHPRKTWLIGAVVLGHLTRAWPPPIDPIHQAFAAVTRPRSRRT